jgi:hypothetical protein
MIRNKKGELAMNTEEKAEIRKDYFDKLLNTEQKELNKETKILVKLNSLQKI